jgi:hypothetical protein
MRHGEAGRIAEGFVQPPNNTLRHAPLVLR